MSERLTDEQVAQVAADCAATRAVAIEVLERRAADARPVVVFGVPLPVVIEAMWAAAQYGRGQMTPDAWQLLRRAYEEQRE